jgi:hypothetical protein
MPNLALSKEESKEYGLVSNPEPPKYPYGLCITLDDGSLEKLALGMPEVGTEITFTAKAVVEGVRSSQMQGGDAETSVNLQITDMEITSAKEDSAASLLYGDND